MKHSKIKYKTKICYLAIQIICTQIFWSDKKNLKYLIKDSSKKGLNTEAACK